MIKYYYYFIINNDNIHCILNDELIYNQNFKYGSIDTNRTDIFVIKLTDYISKDDLLLLKKTITIF
jgi:hypothetical protein